MVRSSPWKSTPADAVVGSKYVAGGEPVAENISVTSSEFHTPNGGTTPIKSKASVASVECHEPPTKLTLKSTVSAASTDSQVPNGAELPLRMSVASVECHEPPTKLTLKS